MKVKPRRFFAKTFLLPRPSRTALTPASRRGISQLILLLCAIFFTGCLKQYEPVPGPSEYNEELGYYRVNKPEKAMEALMEKVIENRGASGYLTSDPALRAVARNISHYFKTEGTELIDSIQNDTIMNFLGEMGVTESAYQTLFLQTGSLDKTREVIVKTLGPDIAARRFTHYGIGVVPTWFPPSKIISIILTRKAIELESFPRRVSPHKDYDLQGYVSLPGKQLTIYVQGKNGTRNMSPKISGAGRFHETISFNESGENIVEMMLDGPSGPEVAALFTVDVEGGDASGREQIIERVPVKSVAEARKRLLELANRERSKIGLKKLKEDEKSNNVAQLYAEEMRDTGQVAHISPASGDVAARAKKGGIKFAKIAENVAVNQSAEDVHLGFMRSPAHRMNIVDGEVGKAGIGVAFSADKSHMYVVEIFVKYQ